MCLSEDVKILMGRERVLVNGRVYTTRGRFREAAEYAGGEMSICLEQVEVITANGKVNGVFNIRDLVAEIKVRSIYESAVFASKYPDRAP